MTRLRREPDRPRRAVSAARWLVSAARWLASAAARPLERLRPAPVIRQMEATECGAACLAMVLRRFGRRVPLEEVRELTGTGRDGVSALAIVRAARAYGLRARGVRADVADLRHLPPGSVLHWEFSHFVVFERAGRSGARLADPARGRVLVPWERLRGAYTGVAITFEPGGGFERGGAPARGAWRYLRPILGQATNLTRVVVASLVIRIVALALPLLTAVVVDRVVPREDRRMLAALGVGVAIVVGYQFLTAFLRANLLLELRTRLDLGLTLGFVDHLVELPHAFFLKRSAGDLMMRMQSNTAIREILTTGSLSAVLDGAFASLYLILLLLLSPMLAGVVAAVALAQIATLALSWRRNQRLMSESLQAQADAQSYAYEMLAGIGTLKACGAEHRAADRWSGLFADQINIDLRRGRLTSAVDSVMSTLNVAAPLVILLAGAYQVSDGVISLGTMLSASALATGFLGPLATMVSSGLQFQLMASYLGRITDVMDTPREQPGERLRSAGRLTGAITTQDVSFRYSPLSPEVVRRVSLDIRPGQRIGIAGRSGSGKSTLAHLLLGLYQPSAGRIEYDGQDLASLDARSLRRQLGIVTQHPYVFGSSIRDNIALPDPGLPLDAVIEAARLACVDEDIMAMPMGYETVLHDGGASLSGGQRQRIALARALVHRPSILLLDEATSELDTVTEQQVYQNLAGLAATSVVIAHRLSTLRDADLIIVLDKGAIAEAGNHTQLLEQGGLYWSLVHAQAGTPGPVAGGPGRRLPAQGPASGGTGVANSSPWQPT